MQGRVTMKLVLIVAAVVDFAICALMFFVGADVDRDVILGLIPLGLALWATSQLVP